MPLVARMASHANTETPEATLDWAVDWACSRRPAGCIDSQFIHLPLPRRKAVWRCDGLVQRLTSWTTVAAKR